MATRKLQTPGGEPAAQHVETTEPEAAAPAASDGLPDQSEVDPYSIKRAVMTKQGWVCPATIGPKVKE